MTLDSRPRRLLLALTTTITAMAGAACSRPGAIAHQGYVEGEFVHVAAGTSGRLEQLFVQRGQTIAAGAPLFRLEADQESAAVRQAEQTLAATEAQLADLGTGKRSTEIDVGRAQLEQARANEKLSASQLLRDMAQLEAGGIPRMQIDVSRARHEVDVARVRELEGQLQVAELSARPEQIRAQTAQVAAASAAIDQARWRLAQKNVVAMRAGAVEDTLFEPGEWVPAGAAVVRMLPPGNVKVRFFVPQALLGRFQPGQKVTIRVDGGPQPTFAATVTFVATGPEFTPPILYSNENRSKLVFMVEARPAEADGPLLHPGQPVEVVAQ